MKKMIILCVLILLTSCSSASVDEAATTVVVVRHAEKLKGRNPSLSFRGRERAIRLSKKFSTLSAVYSTDYKRTIETATPAAVKFGLKINSSIAPTDYKALKADIIANYSGKTILVVGHSNTVPNFINSLFASKKTGPISEDDSVNFFVVKIVNGFGKDLKEETY